MSRIVVLKNYTIKPAKEIGRVVLTDSNQIEFHDLPDDLQEQMTHGILDWSQKKRIMPSDGAAFLDAVKKDFTGGYIRAEEQ